MTSEVLIQDRTIIKYRNNNLESDKISLNDTNLICDQCNSRDIVEIIEGYVCRSCGIVLEQQKLEYHPPYGDNQKDHAPLSRTQLGAIDERFKYPTSYSLKRLHRLHLFKKKKDTVIDIAKSEISRILHSLKMAPTYKPSIFLLYNHLYSLLKSRTRFRNPEKLVPLTQYFFCKINNIPISEKNLLHISRITKKGFTQGKSNIRKIFPEYAKRDVKQYVSHYLVWIIEKFQLEMNVFFLALKILHKIWNIVKYSKDTIIIGLVASVSIIYLNEYKKRVSVNKLCSFLGISTSTITKHMEKICYHYGVKKINNHVLNCIVIKKLLLSLGLISSWEILNTGKIQNNYEIEIKPDEATQIQNPLIYNNYLLDNINRIKKFPKFKSILQYSCIYNLNQGSLQIYGEIKEISTRLSNLDILEFYTGKGPPIKVILISGKN